MIKKFILAVVMIILGLVFFVGCGRKSLLVTDFDGLKDLPRNPVRIVFTSNSRNYDEDSGVYGAPIDYEIESTKITQITEKVFTLSYTPLPKNVLIDISSIIYNLSFYNAEGEVWTVQLGPNQHNERWYLPLEDKFLILTALLYDSIIK